MTSSSLAQQILNFYQVAEKLKFTLRHSWLSDGRRQESVAEHSFMMGLLALVLLPKLKQQLDTQKVLQMILLHDLAEAVTSDMPVWRGLAQKSQKVRAERTAIKQIFATLDEQSQTELTTIWEEYEARQSPEALFVKALDTFDVIAQHNLADLSSWDDNDYLWQLSPLQDAFFDFDPILRQLKQIIDQASIAKVQAVGHLDKLDQAELKKRTQQ